VVKIDDSKVVAATGENCDRVAFTEYVVRNMTLDKYRSRLDRSVKATAHMVRGEVRQAHNESTRTAACI
jgi:20S proteasome alpha/beta subunit